MTSLLLVAVLEVAAPKTYAETARVHHLRESMAAVVTTEQAVLEQAVRYMSVIDRNRCTSIYPRLRVECTMTAARRYCRDRRRRGTECPLYIDLIANNFLTVSEFVNAEARYGIMVKEPDFRAALQRALRHEYALLASDFFTRGGGVCHGDLACLSERIDRYCIEAADLRSMSWQGCAGALAWMIAQAEKP